MSVINLNMLSNNELKKKVGALFSLDNWSDECGNCKRPSLLHKGGPCTRPEKEPPDVITRIWSELKKRIKPTVAVLKADFRKEAEYGLLLDGLKKLLLQILDQKKL